MPRMKFKKKRPRKNIIYRKKFCMFCKEKIEEIDYKDAVKLSRFTTERGKITPRRVSGVCARHQRRLACSIKRARYIALMPFIKQ